MKKIILPIFLGFALVATSCEKMLDIPQKGVVSYDDFYASDEDCEAALANMYANYITNVSGTEGIDNPEQVILNYSSDDILAAGGNANDHEPFRNFCEFRYDDANGTLKSAYQRYYYAIYHANLVISNFTNENRNGTAPKFESAYTKQAVAEARVMRAYLHMMTALLWNCPPILDRVYEGDELPTNAESQEQVLKWVVDECEKAIASGSLPKRNGTSDKNATARMSVGFAQFIAGKAAMFMNDAATARKYLSALINSGDYALVPSEDYWINFHIQGDGGVEKIFEPNVVADQDWLKGFGAYQRTRWMVANVFCWRSDHLASNPKVHDGFQGWNGGAIQNDFAKKFLEHDGDSPRRLACFLTEEEWLYTMDWAASKVNNGTREEKMVDPSRGISSAEGVFSHGPYFEWKHMVYTNPPAILTKGKSFPSDHIPYLGYAQNGTNFKVARLAEAYLLYAEACIGSSDEAKGLAALNAIQERSGSGKISDKLTWEAVAEEKQYEMWFESCRFLDLVRWSKQGKVDLNKIFNASGIHKTATTVKDEFFTEGKPGYQKEHKLFTVPCDLIYQDFVVGKHEYFPFPLDVKNANPNLHDVLGWASAK
ncbi:MAG: RagB/SusD family nutrient uptake outer membrane protein [Bacteroidales bacterium]|nr:RagB/SusD family nutrient uptake outer membrane protein [Bacteroidales bacterium]